MKHSPSRLSATQGRVVAWSCIAVLGFAGWWLFEHSLRTQLAVFSWPTTTGKLTEFHQDMRIGPDHNGAEKVSVAYEIRVKGETYSGNSIGMLDLERTEERFLLPALSGLPKVGAHIQVSYDPEDPHRSVAAPRVQVGGVVGLVCLVFLMVGIAVWSEIFALRHQLWAAIAKQDIGRVKKMLRSPFVPVGDREVRAAEATHNPELVKLVVVSVAGHEKPEASD